MRKVMKGEAAEWRNRRNSNLRAVEMPCPRFVLCRRASLIPRLGAGASQMELRVDRPPRSHGSSLTPTPFRPLRAGYSFLVRVGHVIE